MAYTTETVPAVRIVRTDLIETVHNGENSRFSEVLSATTKEQDGLNWIVLEISAPRYCTEDSRTLVLPSGFGVKRVVAGPVLEDDDEPDTESFPEYLRRVGDDYKESGSDATAEDYGDAARKIERSYAKISHIRANLRGEQVGLDDELREIQTILYSR